MKRLFLSSACLILVLLAIGCGTKVVTTSTPSEPVTSNATATDITNDSVGSGLVAYKGIEFTVPTGFEAGVGPTQFQGHDEILVVKQGSTIASGNAVVIMWPGDTSGDSQGGYPEWQKVAETEVAGHTMVKWVTSGGQGSPVFVLLNTPVGNLKATGQATMAAMKPNEVAESIINSVKIP